jgi:hypothetical protein
LNLGLRWDGVPHTYEANNQSANFYPNLYDQPRGYVRLAGQYLLARIRELDLAWQLVPVPAWAPARIRFWPGYQFYTNGIGIPGVDPWSSEGSCEQPTGLLSVRASALPMI